MDTEDFLAACLRNPVNDAIADELFRLALPDAWIVSGCLVQTVWNVLTSRPVDHGINDYDIFYFDPDTSWQAEDSVICQLQGRLEQHGVRIEVRNQARVHLWYPEKHGLPYPALLSSSEGIDRFLTQTTQVGIRRSPGAFSSEVDTGSREENASNKEHRPPFRFHRNGKGSCGHDVYAPNGFDDIANMIVRPNPGPNFSAASYEAKTLRWKMRWPEITVLAADSAGNTVNGARPRR
jgi:hypothetical protein